MNKSIKKLLVVVSCFLSLPLLAQVSLPNELSVFLPEILNREIIGDRDANALLSDPNFGQKGELSKKPWDVFSDRDNNVTYKSPNRTSGEYSRLSFKDPLRIAKIENGFALVYEEPKIGTANRPSASAVSKGWVPMENLLLWNHCLANEFNIYHKALLVTNLDNIDQRSNTIGYGYNAPSTAGKGEPLDGNASFYFVMKKAANGMVLLSRQSETEKATLYKWVPKDSYIAWDQRSCIEFSWEEDDCEAFVRSRKRVDLYSDERLTTRGSYYSFQEWNVDEDYKYREPGSLMRYPLLGSPTDKYYCSAFVNSKEEDIAIAQKQRKELEEERERLLKDFKTVNLIIVIDGTNSMKPYFSAMKDAIKEGIARLSSEEVRIGVVIYRDHEDGQYMTEKLSVCEYTNNRARIERFLDTGGEYGVKSVAHTVEEDLYEGLNVALDANAMGFTKDQSNLLLVVGDCGNHLNSNLKREDLVKKMIDNHFHVMGFQVQKLSDAQAYNLFTSQMNWFLYTNLSTVYNTLGSKPKFLQAKDGTGYNLDKESIPDSKSYYIGSNTYAIKGGKMEPARLVKLIDERIGDFVRAIRTQREMIINAPVINVGSTKGNTGTKIDSEFLKQRAGKFATLLAANNGFMVYNAYVRRQDQATARDYWKPVIFISSAEFKALLETLKPLSQQINQSGINRKAYTNAMRGLLKAYVGGLSPAKVDAMSPTQVTDMLLGVNVETNRSTKRSLIEIEDRNIVPDNDFQAITQKFAQKYAGLAGISQSDYPYQVSFDNLKYYWIPVEDLP